MMSGSSSILFIRNLLNLPLFENGMTLFILGVLQVLDQLGGLDYSLIGRALRGLADILVQVEITPHLVSHSGHVTELRNQEYRLVCTFVLVFQQELVLVFYLYVPLFLIVVDVRTLFIRFLYFEFVFN
jgi:hypothetical protein